MTSLERWKQRARRRARARVSLDEAVLGGRMWRYAFHRLRWLLSARLLSYGVHLVELVLLVRVVSGAQLGVALIAQNLAVIVGGAWWGALEVMRRRVREMRDLGHAHAEASLWLTRSVMLAAVIALLAAGAIPWTKASGPAAAYLLVVAGRCSIDLVVRCFYSGVYARGRVYRPLRATVAVELVSLGLASLLWPLASAWALPIAVALATVISRAVVVGYARRSYRLRRLATPSLRRSPAVATPWPEVALAALAGVSARLGPLAIVLLLVFRAPADAVLVVHLLAPLLTSAGSWPYAYYHDFTRTAHGVGRLLGERLSWALHGQALAVAGLLLVPALLVLAARGRLELGVPVAATLVAAGLLGAAQVKALARSHFESLVAGAVALMVVLAPWAVGRLGQSSGELLLALAISMSVAALVTGRFGRRARRPDTSELSNQVDWLEALRLRPRARVGAVRVAEPAVAATAARAIRAGLGEGGAVAVCRRRWIIWHHPESEPPLEVVDVAAACAGTSSQVESFGVATGAEQVARLREILGADGESLTREQLLRRFDQVFGDGLCADLRDGSRALVGLEAEDRRAIWADARTFARGGRGRRSRWAVSALVEDGCISMIFAVPRASSAAGRRRWDELVRAASVEPRLVERPGTYSLAYQRVL
ncbi:MAG: hypothetical protein KJO07_10995 [Deltaproteobacteria bacterium]|nr:hypothetical protein [Deltaproteobacteria bacterium]